ncbi:MAG: MBL fold metallo-hydrolase [Patescibacteria group bacterium]|nr:MBL fold metallo-hydrolase [Patescibacteria group bacterium]
MDTNANAKGYSLTACGGVGNATGANFWVQTPSMQFLVDCGLVQGSQYATDENRQPFPYKPGQISCLLITHAHMDHVGRIPKLVKEGFKGVIYSTPETKDLAALMLDDALGLITREAEQRGVPAIYGAEDVAKAMSLWKTVGYHAALDLSTDVSMFLKDAGHVLGSSIIEVMLRGARGGAGVKIAFTGDLGNSPTPLLRDTEYVTDADYIVMESVYGDRNHEAKNVRDERLKTVLGETLRAGGTVVIPAFSLERTQVILYEIHELFEKGALPTVPVYLDSPLGLKVTEVYKKYEYDFNADRQKEIAAGGQLFDMPGLKIVRNHQESSAIDRIQGPKIIISGSGMSVGGRVINHERDLLGDPKATIIIVGYQVPGSLGREIEERAKRVNVDGTDVSVHARIETISGYSSHKDSDHLVEFVSHAAPRVKEVFVAMGETKSSAFLAQRLRDELSVNAIVAEKGKEYSLD